MDRRRFLYVAGMMGTIAGCTGTGENAESTPSPDTATPTETETETVTKTQLDSKTETATATETETPDPADISVRDLSVGQSTVDAGESVRVSVKLVNEGEKRGRQTITLFVDGKEAKSKEPEIGGGRATKIEFTVSTDIPKIYSVSVGALETSFEAVATEVGGVMDSDTTWTTEDEPYSVVDTVQVAEGTTLTIEPGVTVWAGEKIGRDPLFSLHGEIIAQGTSSDRITIDGGVSRPTIFDADGSSPEAFLDAEHCLFRNSGPFWMRGHGGFNLRRSELRNVDSSYIWYPYQDTSGEYDIPRTEVNIEYNKLLNSGGFSIGHDDRFTDETITVNIRHNVFSGWKEATYGGLINNWASYGTSQTLVEYNSFLEMTDKVVLKLPSGYDNGAMSAPNNYWDTTNKETIEQMIYDENDDIDSAGEIGFTPILEESHPETPTV